MPAKAMMSSHWRKQPTILLALIGTFCLAVPAFAQGSDAPGVTILRGSGAPPPPPAPVTIVQRETTVYQPVYVPQPDYYAYYAAPIFLQRFPHHHVVPHMDNHAMPRMGIHPVPRVGVVTTNLPNGWPLLRR